MDRRTIVGICLFSCFLMVSIPLIPTVQSIEVEKEVKSMMNKKISLFKEVSKGSFFNLKNIFTIYYMLLFLIYVIGAFCTTGLLLFDIFLSGWSFGKIYRAIASGLLWPIIQILFVAALLYYTNDINPLMTISIMIILILTLPFFIIVGFIALVILLVYFWLSIEWPPAPYQANIT